MLRGLRAARTAAFAGLAIACAPGARAADAPAASGLPEIEAAMKAGDWARARVSLEALTARPGAEPRHWMWLGNARFRLGDFRGAIEAYGKVTPEDPELFALAGLGRSRAYRQLGDLPRSIQEFQRIDDPKSQSSITKQLRAEKAKLHESLNAMGLDLIRAKRYTDALAALQQASSIQTSAENSVLLGWTFYELQQWQSAVSAFERVVELPQGKPYWEEAEDFINLVLGKRSHIGFSRPFVNLQLAFGWNSNFSLDPASVTPTARGIEGRFSLLTGMEWFAQGSWSSTLAYQAGLAKSLRYGQRRYLSHGLLMPWSYTRARSRFSITPSWVWSTQDALLIASRFRVRAEMSFQRLRSQWGYTLGYSRSWSQNQLYPYLYGNGLEAGVFWRRSFGEWNWLVRIPVTRDTYADSQTTEPLSSWSAGLETTFSFTLAPGFWWEPQAGVTGLLYDRRSSSDVSRVDKRFSVSQRFAKSIASNADLFLSQEYFFQDSNLPLSLSDQRLRQFSVTLGTDLRF